MSQPYSVAVRSPRRPRGKWHLLVSPTSGRTICDQMALGWYSRPRSSLDSNDICTNCLRDTP